MRILEIEQPGLIHTSCLQLITYVCMCFNVFTEDGKNKLAQQRITQHFMRFEI